MVDWNGIKRILLQEKLLCLAGKEKYGGKIADEEHALLSLFDCLNIKKDTETNIENFFEVLDEVIYFVNNIDNLLGECDD